jgi:hypothetical protein
MTHLLQDVSQGSPIHVLQHNGNLQSAPPTESLTHLFTIREADCDIDSDWLPLELKSR